MNRRPYTIPNRRQQGLTLVEIMVALTVSLVLMAGIIQIFIGNKQTFRLQEGLARMQENARFSLDFMSRDIRQAGYVGCIRSIGSTNNLIKNPPSTFSPDSGVQGWEFTDGCCNIVDCHQTITVKDTVPPVLFCAQASSPE